MKATTLISNAPIVIILLLVSYKILDYHGYQILVVEDGLIENLTSIFYFAAAVVSSLIARQLYKSKLYHVSYTHAFLLLTIALAVIAFEEVSWGQRIFGVDTPGQLRKINVQGETNIHNLSPFHNYVTMNAYIIIGFYGSFGWLLAKQLGSVNGLLFPQQESFLYFLPILLSAFYLEYVVPGFNKAFALDLQRSLYFIETIDNEVSEMVLGLGFLVFLTYRFRHLLRMKELSAPGVTKIMH